MIFRKRKSINPFKIYLDNIEISESDVFNFLGFHFNNTLTWKTHISVVSSKISKIIYIIRSLQFIYPVHILKLIYSSLIQSKLLYGLLLWGTNLNDIRVIQKKAIRSVTAFLPILNYYSKYLIY